MERVYVVIFHFGAADAHGGIADKFQIKTLDVMPNQNILACKFQEILQSFRKLGGIRYHIVGNMVYPGSGSRDMPSRVHQRGKLIHGLMAPHPDGRNLYNLICIRADASGLQIKDHIIADILIQTFSFVPCHGNSPHFSYDFTL